MTPITPDEALYAFMDGELELGDEQPLFDALASHPELRTEMKDVLAIRNAVHRDVLFPPVTAETGILAAAGFVPPVGAAVVATAPSFVSRAVYTGGGVLAGLLLAYFLFTPGTGTPQNTQAIAGQGSAKGQVAEVRTGAVPEQPAVAVRVETLYVRVPAKTPPSQPLTQSPLFAENNSLDNARLPETSTNLFVSKVPEQSQLASSPTRFGSLVSDSRFGEASPLTPGSVDLPVSITIRSLASSLNGDVRIPASVNDALVANSAFALVFPVATNQRAGVEFGVEAFHQVFQSTRNGRSVQVDQTPVLFWLGGTYEAAPWEAPFLEGLRPFVSVTGAYAFSQGPVARGTIGLQYQPAGPVRMSAGYDMAGLWYWDNSNQFFSFKKGFSYGLSVDLGALR